MVSQVDYGEWTHLLATRLKQNNSLRTPAIERAFRSVQRHLFVRSFHLSGPDWSNQQIYDQDPEQPRAEHLRLIYDDRSLITRSVDGFGTKLKPR